MFTLIRMVSCQGVYAIDVGDFMWNLHSLTNCF